MHREIEMSLLILQKSFDVNTSQFYEIFQS